jgi:hypothetical protein
LKLKIKVDFSGIMRATSFVKIDQLVQKRLWGTQTHTNFFIQGRKVQYGKCKVTWNFRTAISVEVINGRRGL